MHSVCVASEVDTLSQRLGSRDWALTLSSFLSSSIQRRDRSSSSSCFHLFTCSSLGRRWLWAQEEYTLVAHCLPHKGGAWPILRRLCHTRLALCPIVMIASRGTGEPSAVSKYGYQSSLSSSFWHRPHRFSWVARPSVSPEILLQWVSKAFAVQNRTLG